jgi:hypothetical protein
MNDSSNVRVALTGAVYVAPVDPARPLPGRATDQLGPEWKALGYISEDGVKEAFDIESDEIKSWQNSDIVRKVITKYGVTYSMEALETKEVVLRLFYGDTHLRGQGAVWLSTYTDTYTATYGTLQPGTGDLTGIIGVEPSQELSLIIDVIDGDQHIRRYVPRATLIASGEITLVGNEATKYPLEFHALPDSSLGGSALALYNRLR